MKKEKKEKRNFGETNDKSNDHEGTYAISNRFKKTETQIKTKTKKAGKINEFKQY